MNEKGNTGKVTQKYISGRSFLMHDFSHIVFAGVLWASHLSEGNEAASFFSSKKRLIRICSFGFTIEGP